MSASVIYTGRLQGQTSGGTAINTVNPVEILSDGAIRFADPLNSSRQILIEPGNPDVMKLMRALFIGTGGPATSGIGPFFGSQ